MNIQDRFNSGWKYPNISGFFWTCSKQVLEHVNTLWTWILFKFFWTKIWLESPGNHALTYAACWPSALKYCIKYSTRVYNVYVNILYSNINILRTRLPMSLHPSLPTHKFINSEKTHNHQTWSRTCVVVPFHSTLCGFFSSPTDCKNAPAVSIAKVSTVSSPCLGALSPRKKSRLCSSTCRL